MFPWGSAPAKRLKTTDLCATIGSQATSILNVDKTQIFDILLTSNNGAFCFGFILAIASKKKPNKNVHVFSHCIKNVQ